MSQLAPEARKLVATSGANFWYPAVTEDELQNDQQLISAYRSTMGQRRVLMTILGVSLGITIYSYIRGAEK
jgi:hypothetical protein